MKNFIALIKKKEFKWLYFSIYYSKSELKKLIYFTYSLLFLTKNWNAKFRNIYIALDENKGSNLQIALEVQNSSEQQIIKIFNSSFNQYLKNYPSKNRYMKASNNDLFQNFHNNSIYYRSFVVHAADINEVDYRFRRLQSSFSEKVLAYFSYKHVNGNNILLFYFETLLILSIAIKKTSKKLFNIFLLIVNKWKQSLSSESVEILEEAYLENELILIRITERVMKNRYPNKFNWRQKWENDCCQYFNDIQQLKIIDYSNSKKESIENLIQFILTNFGQQFSTSHENIICSYYFLYSVIKKSRFE